jgi:hypothetical protein
MAVKKYSEYYGISENSDYSRSSIYRNVGRIFEDNDDAVAGHKTYFTEALSCLDSLLSMAISANNEKAADSRSRYDSFIAKVSTVASTAKGLYEIWDSLASAAKSIRGNIKSAPPAGIDTKEFDSLKAEKAKAQKDLDTQQITKKEFDEISYDIHKRAMSATKDADPALAASMPRYIKSGDLLVEAITQFKKGAELEIEKMDKEGGIATALKEVSNIAGAKRSEDSKDVNTKAQAKMKKEYDDAKAKSDKKHGEDYGSEKKEDKEKTKIPKKDDKKTNESLTGILDKGVDLVRGVGQSLFGGKSTGATTGTSASTLISQASNLKAALVSMSSEIDNVIAYDSNVSGKSQDSSGSAKESGSNLIDFVRRSYEYVTKVEAEIDSKGPAKVKKDLDGIESDFNDKIKKGGIFEKWKNSVMGGGSKSVSNSAYLDQGKDLAYKAKQEIGEIVDRKYLEDRVKGKEPAELIKSLVSATTGKKKTTTKKQSNKLKKTTSNKRKRMAYKTFPPKPTSKDKVAVAEYQKRLQKLGYLKKGSYKLGVYDETTKKATKLAMHFVAILAAKKYNSTVEKDFRGYQLDLAVYVEENRAKVVSKLAGKSAGSASAYKGTGAEESPEREMTGDEEREANDGDSGSDEPKVKGAKYASYSDEEAAETTPGGDDPESGEVAGAAAGAAAGTKSKGVKRKKTTKSKTAAKPAAAKPAAAKPAFTKEYIKARTNAQKAKAKTFKYAGKTHSTATGRVIQGAPVASKKPVAKKPVAKKPVAKKPVAKKAVVKKK